MYENFFFSKFISHKDEIKVNNDSRLRSEFYLPIRSLKCDSIEPNILIKARTCF